MDAKQFNRLKAVRRLAALDIPEAYRNARLADLTITDQNREAVESVRDWASHPARYWPLGDEPGKGLLLFGPPGTYKTLLSAIVLESVVRRGATGAFIRLSAFQRMQSQRIDLSKSTDEMDVERGQEIRRNLDRLYEVGLLVVDDVGQEYGSEYTAKNFSDLLRCRYDDGHPTILTSNQHPDTWDATYPEATRSFVHQACYIIPTTGEDQRLRAARGKR